MRTILLLSALLLSAEAHAGEPLKQGVFNCEDSNSRGVPLRVTQHPAKANKVMLNWENRDRILHREDSISGAVRYEGLGSKLVYIQTPHHSVLLNSNTMKAILTECIR